MIMKTIKLLFATLVVGLVFTSCSVVVEDIDDPYYPNLEDVVVAYDLWYIDYNKTTGNGDVPFLSNAFTISFLNGELYANNNLVGIGDTGNGYGIKIGYYNTNTGILEIDHNIDGFYDLEVVQLSLDRLKLIDNYNHVTYYLEGYQNYNFDYDLIFYDNIEYFLQEYEVWEKTFVSETGDLNAFDNENFLSFTKENTMTFYSSLDEIGANIADVIWDYVGDYSVANAQGYDDQKILTLDYDLDDNDIEKFELVVISDEVIELYHISSGTTYQFTGRGYLQFKKNGSGNKEKRTLRKVGEKRIKIDSRIKIGEKQLK